MRINTFFVLLCILFGVILYAIWEQVKPGHGPASMNPMVLGQHSATQDRYLCPLLGYGEVSSKRVQLVQNQIADLHLELQKRLNPLLSQVAELTGRPFPYDVYIVRTNLCPKFRDWQLPPSISIDQYIAKDEPVDSLRLSADDINQLIAVSQLNILQTYVFYLLPRRLRTPLLIRYKSESWTTLAHLHAYALQKALTQKNRHLDNLWLKTLELATSRGAAHTRALQIIDLESPEAFIRELAVIQK